MSNKKDLTRIEDLGEFVHALNAEDEFTLDEDFSSGLPDLPASDSEETPLFSDADGSSDFTSEETDFEPEEPASENDESVNFGTDDFTSNFELKAEATEEKEVEPFTYEESKTDDWNIDVPLTETQDAEPPNYTPSQDFKTPETFEDLKKFSESSSFTGMATEGNPSFSVLIKNVRFIEDVNDIILLFAS